MTCPASPRSPRGRSGADAPAGTHLGPGHSSVSPPIDTPIPRSQRALRQAVLHFLLVLAEAPPLDAPLAEERAASPSGHAEHRSRGLRVRTELVGRPGALEEAEAAAPPPEVPEDEEDEEEALPHSEAVDVFQEGLAMVVQDPLLCDLPIQVCRAGGRGRSPLSSA